MLCLSTGNNFIEGEIKISEFAAISFVVLNSFVFSFRIININKLTAEVN